jgi:hypothetical protein
MSVYMRGYDRGQERGRAEVGLSGDHAPSDAGKSLPGLVMMVGKLMVKLSGIFPGQLHPELALSVQPRAGSSPRWTHKVSILRYAGSGTFSVYI